VQTEPKLTLNQLHIKSFITAIPSAQRRIVRGASDLTQSSLMQMSCPQCRVAGN
jgi:hypothetical protein